MNRFSTVLSELSLLVAHTFLCGLIGLVALSGCHDKVGAPVDVNSAQQILTSAMEGWKEGKTPDDLLNETPPIIVQDPEWNEQTKLLDYEIVSDDSPAGPNLIATVKLKLSKSEGAVKERTATYVIGPSPKFTVYRNLMR